MLLTIGILVGAYVGMKAFETKRTKNTSQKKKQLTIQTTKILDKSSNIINDPEKQHNHYLKICTINLGITVIRLIYPFISLLNYGLLIYTSLPFFKNAKRSLMKRKIGYDLLFSIFMFVCLVQNMFVVLALNNWFYFLSSKFVARTQDNTKKLFTNIFQQLPRSVWILKDKIEINIPLEKVQPNDIVVINTGEVVPIDGIIIKGMAMIDQHSLTGESQPVEKSVNDQVFTSTIIMAGKIYVKVGKVGIDTAASKITQILNQSTHFKTHLQSWGEEWADKGSLPILAMSVITLGLLGTTGALVVLNSGFGNRIRLFSALGTLNYLNLAYQKGILVKDGRALEALNQVDTVLFDKTGTLTQEQPTVGRIILFDHHYKPEDILRYAAAAEHKLAHPIAKAILKQAEISQLTIPNIEDSNYKVGYGVVISFDNKVIKVGSARFMTMEGILLSQKVKQAMDYSHREGYSLVMIAIDDQLSGAIEIQPLVRSEVKPIIKRLREHGVKHIAIVSGDHQQPTQKLAEALGMDSYFAETLPENKAGIVEQLQKQGRTVCFVGDGINDSVAMQKANVSISLRGASSIATDIAQVVLMDGNLARLPELFDISKNLSSNLHASLVITLLPTFINISGAYLFHLSVITSLITKYISFFVGTGNALLPIKQIQSEKMGKRYRGDDFRYSVSRLDEGQPPPSPPYQ